MTHGGDPTDGAGEPEPRLLLLQGMLLHVALAASALAWLWLRDRMDVLPERAIGERGLLAGSGAGLATGAAAAMVLAVASRRLPRLREVEAMVGRIFVHAKDTTVVAFVVMGSLAEELFFRLAVQDLFGLAGSVAMCVAVNSCVAGWSWAPIAALHALALGLLVQQGFGLLGSTTANAVMNYFHLRRLQCS